MTFAINTLIAALMISFVSWLSGRSPTLAGLVAALPLSTMLILPMSQIQHGDSENTYVLAKSIFLATPVALMFFLPFLFSERLGLSFWRLYLLGSGLLIGSFFLYRFVVRAIFPSSG
jgi:hypothetical protein